MKRSTVRGTRLAIDVGTVRERVWAVLPNEVAAALADVRGQSRLVLRALEAVLEERELSGRVPDRVWIEDRSLCSPECGLTLQLLEALDGDLEVPKVQYW